jgi:hypothetical protein
MDTDNALLGTGWVFGSGHHSANALPAAIMNSMTHVPSGFGRRRSSQPVATKENAPELLMVTYLKVSLGNRRLDGMSSPYGLLE